jgi:hypothetical protein
MTKEQQDWLDEHPTRHSGGWISSFGFAETRSRSGVRRRTPEVPAWRVAADDRRAQLELLAYLIEKEERS